jgi:hypothetical protein
MSEAGKPATGCDRCRVDIVTTVAEQLVKSPADKIEAALDCDHCGTLWAIIVGPLQGTRRDDVRAALNEAKRVRP